jgi:hypothetical protein
MNPRRFGQGSDLLDPGDQAGMSGGSRVKALDGGCGHCHSPERRPAICAAVASLAWHHAMFQARNDI